MALEEFKPMMERCSNCLGCRWIPFDKIKNQRFAENCPSICYNNFNTYSARGRFQLGISLVDKEVEYTDTVMDVINSCTTCGMCDVSCKVCRYNLEPLEYNFEMKAEAVREGKILPKQQKIISSLKNEKTMLCDVLNKDRINWAKELNLKDIFKEKTEILFFPGCKFSYDEKFKKLTKSMVKVLLDIGLDIGTMGNADNCCAGRAYQMGFQGEFNNVANANIKAFEISDVKMIVTPCSDCYYTFKRLYAKNGLKIEVLHIVELIERLIQDNTIKLTKSIPLTVTYHDPCHLGRLGEQYVPWEGKEKKILNQVHTWEPKRPRYNGAFGIYDSPRNVINSIPGIKLVEMDRIREYSWCCGAGGGCSEIKPEFSDWTAGERIKEANSTGAEALITACPWCESNLSNAIDEDGKKIKVLDIIELILQSINKGGSE